MGKSLCHQYHQIRMVFSTLIPPVQKFTSVMTGETIGATTPVVTQPLEPFQEEQWVWLLQKLLRRRLVVEINEIVVNQTVEAYLAWPHHPSASRLRCMMMVVMLPSEDSQRQKLPHSEKHEKRDAARRSDPAGVEEIV